MDASAGRAGFVRAALPMWSGATPRSRVLRPCRQRGGLGRPRRRRRSCRREPPPQRFGSRNALATGTRCSGGGCARLPASGVPAVDGYLEISPRVTASPDTPADLDNVGQNLVNSRRSASFLPVLRRVIRVRLALAAAQRDEHAITLCHGQIPSSIAEWTHRVGGLPPSSHEPPLPRYSRIDVTAPAPTVRPPSRIAKRNPSSSAIGEIKRTLICTLSPGIAISTPVGRPISPVTSVVRM